MSLGPILSACGVNPVRQLQPRTLQIWVFTYQLHASYKIVKRSQYPYNKLIIKFETITAAISKGSKCESPLGLENKEQSFTRYRCRSVFFVVIVLEDAHILKEQLAAL